MDEFHRIAFAVFSERYSLHSQHTARPFIFTFSLYDGNEKNETADSPSAGLFHEGVEVVTPIRFNEGSHASAPLPHAFY
jgi:hypothetical protein